MKPIADGVQLWVRWINDRGGLNGHRVLLVQGDSGNDPARHRALVQDFVERKSVVAFVGQPGESFSGGGSVEYLTKAGVPVIGSEGGAEWYYESPVYFPQTSHGSAIIQATGTGFALEMKARGKDKLAVWACVETQTCPQLLDTYVKLVPRYGVEVVHQARISVGQPDFTAECLSARNAGAQTIVVLADGPTVSRAAHSCARQGYKANLAFFGPLISPKQHASDPDLRDPIVLDFAAPAWFLNDKPQRREFQEALARFAPGLSASPGMVQGWISGKVFEIGGVQAVEPLTKTSVLAALGSIHADPLADLTAPLLFGPGRPATPTACYWKVTPTDGRWFSPDGGQRHCVDYDPKLR